jgi:hypothetical protein
LLMPPAAAFRLQLSELTPELAHAAHPMAMNPMRKDLIHQLRIARCQG